MHEVAKDERVALRHTELEKVCLDQLHYIHSLRMSAFQRLSYLCTRALDSEYMRQDCIQAAQVAMTFLAYRVFAEVQSYPWSLALGDVEKHLDELEAMEVVEDRTAETIKELLESGGPVKNTKS